jgi:DNA-binding LacI/PurR family transcriptional regulator
MEIRLEDERVNTLERLGIPLTMIGRTTQLDNRKYVDRDFISVANTALSYLKKLEHKNVGLMTQVRTSTNDVLGVDSGFQSAILQAAKKNKIAITEIPVRNTASAGRVAFSELQKIAPQATALLALPDLATIGFLSAAREFGLDIPGQFSILALNTPDNQLEMAWPPLSTITVPANAMGRAAAKILINHLEGKKDEISQQLWAGELVVRGTTSPAQ